MIQPIQYETQWQDDSQAQRKKDEREETRGSIQERIKEDEIMARHTQKPKRHSAKTIRPARVPSHTSPIKGSRKFPGAKKSSVVLQ